ncbi:MAG: hypothetical protein WC548_04635 [Candidatus Pacearchaeota archaeon]
MHENLIEKIKQKREFSGLPDSIVERAANVSNYSVKETRALLRKYFGVFLTNKILKGRGEEVLTKHVSSKNRDYKRLYNKISENFSNFKSVVDLGCGVNGLSYLQIYYLLGISEYYGVEASKQIVDLVNGYFDNMKANDKLNCIWLDLFEIGKVKEIIKNASGPKMIFMFQVVDALEGIEKNFSKKFFLEISKILDGEDKVALSFSLGSIGGRKRFVANRKWLVSFLDENFIIEKDFEMFGERFIVFGKK